MMFTFDSQCCDAHQYINLARACLAGECYDPVRPAGIQYWFSLPLRFDLPLEYIMVANWVLLLFSIVLAALAASTLLRNLNGSVGVRTKVLGLIVIAAVHLFFFWPFMHVLLADAPAGLMATIGIFSYLIGSNTVRWPAAAWLILGGIGLGMSAWMRSFYLYPVVIVLALHMLYWVFNQKRRSAELLLLAALIPILIQFNMTWQRYQEWSFIAPKDSVTWKAIHLSDSGIGYDTLLPFNPYRIFPKCEFIPGGMKSAWEYKSLSTFWCYTSRRIAYYWGSDNRKAYVQMKNGTNLFAYGERMDTLPIWSPVGVAVAADAELAPDGKKTAEKISFLESTSPDDEPHRRLKVGFMPTVVGPHTLSIWLWSPIAKELVIRWEQAYTREQLKELTVKLTPEPVRYQLTADFPMEYFLLQIGSDGISSSEIGSAPGEYFYAWGLQLERGAVMTDYSFNDDPAQYRLWSPLLLICNLLAFALAMLLIFPIIKHKQMPVLMALLFFGLMFGEALLILPEQRFVIAANTIMWLLAWISCLYLIKRFTTKSLVITG